MLQVHVEITLTHRAEAEVRRVEIPGLVEFRRDQARVKRRAFSGTSVQRAAAKHRAERPKFDEQRAVPPLERLVREARVLKDGTRDRAAMRLPDDAQRQQL